MDSDSKETECNALKGILYSGTCYTFEIATELENIMSSDCPGGCAIWGLQCAPASWENLCMRAHHQHRDLNRKYIFYVFCIIFFGGLIYICFGGKSDKNDGNHVYDEIDKTPRADDDLYRRAPEEKIDDNPIDIKLRSTIDEIWTHYYRDKNDKLEKSETLIFVQEIKMITQERHGLKYEKEFEQNQFDKLFLKFDKDGSGAIGKGDMLLLIKQLSGF